MALCLRSSTNKTEIVDLNFSLFRAKQRKIDELSITFGKKLSQIYLNHIKNFGIRVFDLETDFLNTVS